MCLYRVTYRTEKMWLLMTFANVKQMFLLEKLNIRILLMRISMDDRRPNDVSLLCKSNSENFVSFVTLLLLLNRSIGLYKLATEGKIPRGR